MAINTNGKAAWRISPGWHKGCSTWHMFGRVAQARGWWIFCENKRIKGSHVIWPSKLLCFNHSHTDGCFNTCQAWKRLVFLIRWAFAKRFHERNIIQCRSASLGSGVSTLTRSECHRHNQTWYGFQPELGKNWQPVQNTRNLFRCQPNQSSRRFVVRPRREKGLAKTSLPKLFGNKSSYQLPTPWTMAPTTNLLIGIQIEAQTHFWVGNAMATFPVCTQLRWRVSGPKKWCLLSFKVAVYIQ